MRILRSGDGPIVNKEKGIWKRQRFLTKGLINLDFFSGVNEIYTLVICGLACLALLFVCMMESKPYQLLFLLPLTFLLAHLIFIWKKLNLFSGIGVLFIDITYLFRMVVIPVIMCFGKFGSKASLQIYQAYVDKAILLMVYEFVLVFLAIILFLVYKNKDSMFRLDQNNANITPQDQPDRVSFLALLKKPFWIILTAMVGVCLLCFVLFPKLLNYFNLYFLSDDAFNIRRTDMINSTPGEVYYPFKIVVELLLTIGPALAAMWIMRLKLSELKKTLLMLALMLLVFIVTTGEQASALKVIVVLFFILMFYLPKYTKRLLLIGVAGGLFVVVFGLVTQMSIKNSSRLSAVFQSYFSGPSNVAMGLKVASQGRSFLVADFLKGLPLVSTFFKNMTSSMDMFNKISDYQSIGREIIPFIAASTNYLGVVLAPLPSVIIAFFTLKIDQYFVKSNTMFGKFVLGYAALSMALMLVMYTEQIFYYQLIAIVLPLFVLLYCAGGKSLREIFKRRTNH